MLMSFAVILLTGMLLGHILGRLKLPPLLGMILTGIILGPGCLNVIDRSVLDISAELRQVALVIILTRAGLSLSVDDLKKAGRPALMMCAVPATFEIVGTVIFAPMLFGVSYAEAALIGSVLAAVSPAVVVPRMIKILNERYGTDKQIPQMILAGASADDVYVIVLFTSFTAIVAGSGASASDFVQIPTSILLGIVLGAAVGAAMALLFKKAHIRDSAKVIIMLSVSFLIMALQDYTENSVRVSGLIAVMASGMTLLALDGERAKRLSAKYNKLWVGAEILLFVLVGAAVDLNSVTEFGMRAVILLLAAMIFRMTGVFVSLIKTKLDMKERLFCMLAYTPKATVQAAIGAVPLSMGLACGDLVLSAAVLAIIITAPFGAFMIDLTYKKLLKKENAET